MADEKRLIDANKIKYTEYRGGGGHDYPENVVTEYEIAKMPTVDAVEVVHGRWNPSRKHMWKMDDGEIDMYAYDQGFHNGPVCLCCGAHYCENCEPDWANTECYDNEHFECSVCGYQSMTATNYCPNCGAKMDQEES